MIYIIFAYIYCTAVIAGEDNPHHYFIATQDVELRRKLRRIPGRLGIGHENFIIIHTGVPLLYINRNTLVLEGASNASHDQAKQVVNK